ncbi:MAG: hypothetical protein AAFX81_12575 [Pseudomonadota bacterium]
MGWAVLAGARHLPDALLASAAALALLASPRLGDEAIVGAMLLGHLAGRHPDWLSRRAAVAALTLGALVVALPDVREAGPPGGALGAC